MSIRESIAILRYSARTRKPFYVVAFLLFGFTSWELLTGWRVTGVIGPYWSEKIDPLVSLATLFIAWSVWRGEIVEEWKRAIPKKLTVVFSYKGDQKMRCNHADLSSEADIRALSQQIGRQMADGVRLDFVAPAIKLKVSEPCQDTETGSFFRPYLAEFELSELPGISKVAGLGKGERLVWEHPFSSEPVIQTQRADKLPS